MNLLKSFAILFLIIVCSFSFAQQDLFLDLEILHQNAQVFQLGDLDFTKTGLAENYFNIRLRNDGNEPIGIRLKLEIFYNGSLIATGISNDFSVPGGGITFLITSQQLAAGTAIIPGNPNPIGLKEYDVDLNAVENLEKQVLQTGFAPSGTYDFILTAVDPTNTNITIAPDQNEGNHSLFISNPTYIELLFPGTSVSENTIREIPTIFPYFQYQTDVPPVNATYNVFVYQKYPEDETTQDVLNHPPILHVEGYTNNFLQYPTDTSINPVFKVVRPLETGRIYYWFVQSIIRSGTGTLTLESDVFRFKIAETGKQAGSAEQILAVLQQILGTRYEQVLRDLREQGFDPNGNLTMDGRNVDLNTLLEIANQISRGEVQIQNVEIY